MASSRKSKRSSAARADLADRVAACLTGVVSEGDRIVVGLSGGVDSVVLLDTLARLAPRFGFRLAAVHVNHQLSSNAARWAAFCRALCRARGIPLKVANVAVPRGNSVEAAARAARYEAFRALRAEYIALAHNQDDQAETLLLQLLRGAGVRGVAGMPKVRIKDQAAGVDRVPGILRPLLDVPRSEIEAQARACGLEWVEDESNAHTYYMRNFLRHDVFPVIERRYPGYRATLARAARHFADAAELLDQLAAQDAAGHILEGALSVDSLRALAPPRARNLLRHFLALHALGMPAERLDEALRQVLIAKHDARVLIELDGARLRRFEGRLHVVREAGPLPRLDLEWHGEREVALPELGGVLELARGRAGGISLARLRGRTVTIGVRRGGERFKPDCRRPRRSLKNLLQEARIPPWQRERTPLIFCDGELVWAAGLGVDCSYRSAPHEPALTPAWRPSP